MISRFIKTAALVIPALATIGCASITQPSSLGLDAQSASVVRQTCNDVMGLRVGPEYEACTGSLADSMRILQDARVTALADQKCEEQGFAAGTPELAKCVVKARRESNQLPAATTTTASVNTMLASNSPQTDVGPWLSYFSMNHSQKDERAELSCAQIGLHPAWGSFGHCVASLKHAIVDVRNTSLP